MHFLFLPCLNRWKHWNSLNIGLDISCNQILDHSARLMKNSVWCHALYIKLLMNFTLLRFYVNNDISGTITILVIPFKNAHDLMQINFTEMRVSWMKEGLSWSNKCHICDMRIVLFIINTFEGRCGLQGVKTEPPLQK